MLNLYPYNNGHLMIIPYRHISDYMELTSEELSEITELNKKSILALRKTMKPQGFNFGANIGKAAGAGIHTCPDGTVILTSCRHSGRSK